MATVDQLIKQYKTDKALQDEVKEIIKDGKVTIPEFLKFAKKHDVKVSLDEIPEYLEKLREAGLIRD